jgi:hypothetical protein
MSSQLETDNGGVGVNCGRCNEFTSLSEIKHIERGKGFCSDCAEIVREIT